ncbi:16S rRNA (adenine(1518)-N(6)/adenine(1519)-N(6))-dimethyltransferase RsmA [Methanomethylovorans sp.]|uniref:16S rRNA (adenine(1518)-N(6)/adenine(1519)-N(6))- dimethyltransferase RsmA n=1 Tax=Methanomethylovorans sp. TaxID=2758717 RepID=UPI00351C6869
MVRSILRHYGIHGGQHDQHFLVDEGILDRIVESANIVPGETILEIGAGIGNLTERLLCQADKVIAVELDSKLVAVLEDRFRGEEKLQIIHGDVLKVELPTFDKVVANLPYSISSEITFKLFKHDFKLGVLMYQYEFAQRMIAKAGSDDYSRLTVNTSYFADASIIMKVPKGAFSPPPQVESAVIKVCPRPAPFNVNDRDFFLKFVTAIFTKRRKKIKNSIIESNHMLGIKNVRQVVSRLPEDLMKLRPENLDPAQLAALSNLILVIQQEV